MAHTWKHKKDEEALHKYPRVKKFMKSTKKDKTAQHIVDYSIDLGELAELGYDVEGLYRGVALDDLEKRLAKKKF